MYVEVRGAGRRVVLVHGFTQTGRCWDRVADEMAEDHEVLLVDAPGHGGSGGVRADLWEGAASLGAAGGRATYIGYSMGARLCLHLALSDPGSVEALVLVSGTPGIEDPVQRADRRAADEALAERIEAEGTVRFLDEWLSAPMFAGLPADAAWRSERERNAPEGLASSLRLAGTGTQDPLWNRLDELHMPVLVVAGADDTKFAALARRMTDAIGPNATLALIPGAGHSVPWEDPDAFLDAYRRWEDLT